MTLDNMSEVTLEKEEDLAKAKRAQKSLGYFGSLF
jgi:hypothetical protein